MATIKQYALNLWRTHATVTQKLGLEAVWGGLDKRAQILSTDVMLAGLIKVLTDKGVVTDSDLNAVYAAIRNADFPALPPAVSAPLDNETVPDPDLGG